MEICASRHFSTIKSDTSGSGGLNLKSGDIIGLEKSYAEFLSIIYQHIKR